MVGIIVAEHLIPSILAADKWKRRKEEEKKGCAYDFCRDIQPSEAMASRRGQIDRAHGVERENSVQKCTHTREEIPSGCGQALSPGAG